MVIGDLVITCKGEELLLLDKKDLLPLLAVVGNGWGTGLLLWENILG